MTRSSPLDPYIFFPMPASPPCSGPPLGTQEWYPKPAFPGGGECPNPPPPPPSFFSPSPPPPRWAPKCARRKNPTGVFFLGPPRGTPPPPFPPSPPSGP